MSLADRYVRIFMDEGASRASSEETVTDIRALEAEHAEMLVLLREAMYHVPFSMGDTIAALLARTDARTKGGA